MIARQPSPRVARVPLRVRPVLRNVFALCSAMVTSLVLPSVTHAQEAAPEAGESGATRYVDFGVGVSAGDFSGLDLALLSPTFWGGAQIGVSYANQSTEAFKGGSSTELERKSFDEFGLGFKAGSALLPRMGLASELALKMARVKAQTPVAGTTRVEEKEKDVWFSEFRFGATLLSPERDAQSAFHARPEVGVQLRSRLSEKGYVVGGRLIRDFEPGVYLRVLLGI